MTALRWLQPGFEPDHWTVYRGGEVALDPVVAFADEAGVRSVDLDPWPFEASYTMTATNAYGESPPSNAVLLPEPSMEIMLLSAIVALVLLRGGGRHG